MTSTPLTTASAGREQLIACEASIEANLQQASKGFLEVRSALAEIQRDRLYRERGYDTFEAYCQKRWNLTRRHAYRLVDADAFVAETAGGPGHALDEIIYKVRRYAARRDPADLVKIAAWAYLVWRFDHPDTRHPGGGGR